MSAQDFYNEGSDDRGFGNNQSYNRNNEEQFRGEGNDRGRGIVGDVVGGAGGYYVGSHLSKKHPHLGGILGAIGGSIVGHEVSEKIGNEHHHHNHHHQQQQPQYNQYEQGYNRPAYPDQNRRDEQFGNGNYNRRDEQFDNNNYNRRDEQFDNRRDDGYNRFGNGNNYGRPEGGPGFQGDRFDNNGPDRQFGGDGGQNYYGNPSNNQDNYGDRNW